MLACWSLWVQVTCSPSARQSLTNWRACKAEQSYTWAPLVKHKAHLLNICVFTVGRCWKSIVVNSFGNCQLPCTLKNARQASEETSKAPPSQEGKDSQTPQILKFLYSKELHVIGSKARLLKPKLEKAKNQVAFLREYAMQFDNVKRCQGPDAREPDSYPQCFCSGTVQASLLTNK